jgi:hypothetical protein
MSAYRPHTSAMSPDIEFVLDSIPFKQLAEAELQSRCQPAERLQ